MSVVRSYAIWNNKGGVGKSTITFHLASRFAEANPKTKVLVLDLCPQSNSSMMLLGGGTNGEKHVLDLCTEATPKTVAGYLSSVYIEKLGLVSMKTIHGLSSFLPILSMKFANIS